MGSKIQLDYCTHRTYSHAIIIYSIVLLFHGVNIIFLMMPVPFNFISHMLSISCSDSVIE